MTMCERTATPLHCVKIKLGDLSECALLRGRQRNSRNHSRLNKLEARNIIFVGLGAMLAASRGLRCVYVGYHKEPEHAPFPDATSLARSVMSILLGVACRPRISLVAPFEKLTRQQILERGLKLNPNLPSETFTCYESESGRECGQCAHCQRKARMLKRCAV
jgi:7-cyano-7-deazaguanine synthase in queuosine biosynthesis